MIGPVFGKSDPSATAHAELIEYNVAVNTRIALFFFFSSVFLFLFDPADPAEAEMR